MYVVAGAPGGLRGRQGVRRRIDRRRPARQLLLQAPLFEEALIVRSTRPRARSPGRAPSRRCCPTSQLRLPHLLGELGASCGDSAVRRTAPTRGQAADRRTARSVARCAPAVARRARRPARDRRRAHPALAGGVPPRRADAPARVRARRWSGSPAGWTARWWRSSPPRRWGRRTSPASACRTAPRAPRAWSTRSWSSTRSASRAARWTSSPAVDGIVGGHRRRPSPARRGNIMARMRMIALFDLSAELQALPLGTGNKTERLFGYFTWHADDSPPVNPIGDLFKTQVWALARHVGVPDVIVDKPATADLIHGPDRRGRLRHLLRAGRPDPALAAAGLHARSRSRRGLHRGGGRRWCSGGWSRPTGSGGCRRWRW